MRLSVGPFELLELSVLRVLCFKAGISQLSALPSNFDALFQIALVL
jgi:hypothetical protein